jgi:hypothetical protein
LTSVEFLPSKGNNKPGGTIDFREGDDPAAGHSIVALLLWMLSTSRLPSSA